MLATLAASPALYVVALLVGWSAIIGRIGRRTARMGTPAIAAAVMFVASTLLMTAWERVDPTDLEAQIFAWHYGLFADALLYLMVLAFILGTNRAFIAAAGALIVLVHLVAINTDTAAQQLAEVGMMCIIAGLSACCFFRVRREDLIGLLLWALLAVSEVIATAHVVDCQILHGMWGIREAGSACEQIYGLDVPKFSLAVGALVQIWIFFRWHWPRPS